MTETRPDVIFVIHQIGSGADGGIRSIGELIQATPDVGKMIVTNLETPITAGFRKSAPIEIWPMVEEHYGRKGSKLAHRVNQVGSRLGNNWRMFQTIRRTGAKVLHANDHRAFWNTVLGAKLAGAKVIFNVRDTMRKEARTRWLWRQALNLCDCFLVLSKEMIAHWRADLQPDADRPGNARKFAYIYSIVKPEIFYPADAEGRLEIKRALGIDAARPAIVYVGRFDDKKAQLLFIEESLAPLAASRPDAVTYFVGDFEPQNDPYAQACADAVKRLGLDDNVRFAGYSAKVADWYRAADIVALASKREGLPRCMIESLACGAPFVSFDVSSTREILDTYECGIAIDQDNYQALAQALASLLDDPERLTRYRAIGPEIVARLFDAKTNGKHYSTLVRELIAGTTPKGMPQ